MANIKIAKIIERIEDELPNWQRNDQTRNFLAKVAEDLREILGTPNG